MRDLIAIAALGVVGWYAWRRGWLRNIYPIAPAMAMTPGPRQNLGASFPELSAYTPPAEALPYLATIRRAEQAQGLPQNLLVRLLDQESKYRADIIDGRVSSRAGARGIAQVMPLTAKDPGYGTPPLRDPLNPAEAIPWAAKYLAGLYRAFGSWSLALAAYNFGPGNVRAGKAWPRETQLYVSQISADVPAVVA